ncbi:hypothetical protein TB1_012143 [Malus domestica]
MLRKIIVGKKHVKIPYKFLVPGANSMAGRSWFLDRPSRSWRNCGTRVLVIDGKLHESKGLGNQNEIETLFRYFERGKIGVSRIGFLVQRGCLDGAAIEELLFAGFELGGCMFGDC